MCIFTYKLLGGTIFIPFAVHRPMNPPFIGRCTLLWMVRCCKERHACGLVPVRWRHSAASYRPMKGMQRQVMFFTFRWIFLSGHACGLVPVRMHYPCPMNPPIHRTVHSVLNGPLLQRKACMRTGTSPHASPILRKSANISLQIFI